MTLKKKFSQGIYSVVTKVVPIILSGGTGARLWPVSRSMHPKQFMEVTTKPLLVHALERASLIADEVLIVTNHNHYHLTKKLIKEMTKAPKVSFLLEPKGLNTAPAIALSVRYIQKVYGDDTVCLLLPADHLILNNTEYESAVAQASELAHDGRIVVFGVQPTKPEVGFGYLEVASESKSPQPLKSFIEKPDLATAQRFLTNGRYYWNSGMICFVASVMAENFSVHAQDVWTTSAIAFDQAQKSSGVTSFEEKSFNNQPDISIDYAVMEKAMNITMVPVSFGWSDVGTWESVADINDVDENGNSSVSASKSYFFETQNTYIESNSNKAKAIVALGVDNLVIVDTEDALLVADRAKSQSVKLVVEELKASEDISLTELPATVHRPWGTYTSLKQEDGYQVKRITVLPGQKLSLQYHHKRAEHWVVTKGIALVQIGEDEFETGSGEYCFIPVGEKHRLTNIGDTELVLIEVQVGNYLGEDDIVRLEDIYGRK